jgi:hypothetical protein
MLSQNILPEMVAMWKMFVNFAAENLNTHNMSNFPIQHPENEGGMNLVPKRMRRCRHISVNPQQGKILS